MFRTILIIRLVIAILFAFSPAERIDAATEDKEKSKKKDKKLVESESVDLYLDEAKSYEQQGQYKDALKYYKKVEKRSVRTVRKANALLAQGRCHQSMSTPWRAYQQYRKAVDEYSNFIPFIETVKLEYDIANQFFSGEKEKFLFISFNSYSKAIEIYDHITKVAPYSTFTVDAIYRSGLLSIKTKSYDDAAEKFQLIITQYPAADKVNDAKIKLADTLLKSASRGDADGTLVEQAYRVLATISQNTLSAEKVAETKAILNTVRSNQAERLLTLAEFYQRPAHKRDDASKQYLSQILSKYHDTDSAIPAEQLMALLENQNSPPAQTKD